ncbi:MAG: hypothetical protein J2P17_33535, partial [Mycobacterium sp.]|nr:hypothetical protein [Mycobacterium sp.]
MFSIHHLPRRARRAGISTLLASCVAVGLLSGMVPSASAQSANALSVSINDVAVTEGIDTDAVFTVTVSGRHSAGITVDWTTLDGAGTSPAVAGLDYVAASNTLTIPASDDKDDHLTGTISVQLKDDATHEPTETFRVKLQSSSVDIAKNGAGTGTATITSDDPQPQLRIRDAQASEDSGSMVFDVDLDRASNVAVTVDYDTCDTKCGATATYSEDYKPTRGTLTFPANTNDTKQIVVPLINDIVYEGNEQLVVQLSNNFNADIARRTATGTIDDDEVKPVLAMTSTGFSVDEGDSDHLLGVDVGLSGLAAQDVTFSYSTSDGSTPAAHDPSDYTATSGTGTIRAGTQLTFIPVTIKGDNRTEGDEHFVVTISNQSSNARLGG